MKQTLLIMVLALGMCSINMSAQTKKQSTTKRTTTSRSTNSQQGGQIMKFRQVGEDGYIWYKIKRGNLFGARDAEGNNIIPIKYTDVSYHCDDRFGVHCFYVKNGDFQGAYTRQGTLVIPPERHYVKVNISGEGGKICWIGQKNGKPEQYVLDAKGKELFSVDCERVQMLCSFDDNNHDTGICYFKIYDSGKEGIYDLNGNLFVPLQSKSMYMYDYGKNLYKYDWDDKKLKSSNHSNESISYDGSTQNNFSPYEDLYFAFKEQRSSSSSSTSSDSSNSSSSTTSSSNSNSNSGNNTTTVVVEHHRDPVPVQQWQACWACGGMGTMGCDNCGGSGTKYIGDRLHRCSRCNGQGIIPCNICYGNKGQYITVYQ